ncbi:hypothetical protein BCR34DRAFT_607069 [Clohesyomyces aquaticus]|uniref:Uncharacterized protein n=1 Tax=Clohesyomyces aquaticus TaxID=1231657 RepID=A0A1Y1YJ64_9PLEO|nr:hypothetical protein BCR34DRAFT_607069 [Clohesyomyces aquaticus]
MAPLPDSLLAFIPRGLLPEQYHPTINHVARALSPTAVQDLHLAKRAPSYAVNPAEGSKPATDFNNKGFQALFAIIGVSMVLGSMWFFFWAKNGGFVWRQDDWEDYKSTVLRRKGPDGKTLSNATKSTKLGGGSIVHGGTYGAQSSIGYTDETGTSADFSEMREVEEGHGKRHFGLRGGEGKEKETKEAKKHRRESTSNRKDPELREYRHEKPARVGGLNRQADGIYTDYSATASDLGSNVSSRPLVKKEKANETEKDKKKEAKAKEMRARERMRQAKEAEKLALKQAAAEAKAKKENEKAEAKKNKAEQKQQKKQQKRTPTEATPTEADITEYAASEAPYTASSAPYAPSAAPIPVPGPSGPRRAPPSAAYSFVTGDDTNTVYSGAYTDNRTAPSEGIPESSYYSDYRPNADTNRGPRRPRSERPLDPNSHAPRTHSSSPRKQHRSSRPSNVAPSDIFTATNGDVRGTMAYPCHIPGLSSAGSVGVSESVSQVGGPSHTAKNHGRGGGGRDVMDGYRRGGVRAVGRRDSLSDSD